MSDLPPTEAPETDATNDAKPDDPKPTETVEFWKQKARDQEKRAKANAAAASELEGIKEASKTAEQKSADALAAAQRDAEMARSEALRFRIASKFQVSDEDADLFLTGTDEETLTRQAQRLTERDTERKKQGNHVPREGTNPPPAGEDPMRQVARDLFKSGT